MNKSALFISAIVAVILSFVLMVSGIFTFLSLFFMILTVLLSYFITLKMIPYSISESYLVHSQKRNYRIIELKDTKNNPYYILEKRYIFPWFPVCDKKGEYILTYNKEKITRLLNTI